MIIVIGKKLYLLSPKYRQKGGHLERIDVYGTCDGGPVADNARRRYRQVSRL
eukprot:gene9337-18451_t